MDLQKINEELREKSPVEIVKWAIDNAKNPVVTTNFRPYEATILHAVTAVKKDIPVLWCDHGYNVAPTYKHAERVIKLLDLNVKLYVPKMTSAHWDTIHGGIPQVEDSNHGEFSDIVKLEPFRRAMSEYKPDVWFTNLRKGQTALRDNLDIISYSSDGVMKVSPFFHWSDEELDAYIEKNGLENEFKYFDPTKALANRECGIHTA